MERVSSAAPRRIDDRVDIEVRRDRDGIIEKAPHETRVIAFGMCENGLDAHLPARARDAHGDFAAVGNDQFFETHGAFSFFRNAFMPDCPSSETRRVAVASMVY